MAGRLLEITFILVLAFLVLTNASGFYQALSALGQTYVGGVKTLQGR